MQYVSRWIWGTRHSDCASVYGDQGLIGSSLKSISDTGIRRQDLWITSKLWNDKHGEADVMPACEKSLRDLRPDYLDLCLVHWPFPNHHLPGCDVGSRNPNAVPYIHENYMRPLRKMEVLVKRGLVCHIGFPI
jgi:diketogulonate reductase-like aldo/keto reductase